jgi:hypothetical protein
MDDWQGRDGPQCRGVAGAYCARLGIGRPGQFGSTRLEAGGPTPASQFSVRQVSSLLPLSTLMENHRALAPSAGIGSSSICWVFAVSDAEQVGAAPSPAEVGAHPLGLCGISAGTPAAE